ncbi:flagellar hook-length control protein FliK [Flavobacterium sp. W21_SRS_FM6]|uniref:flagellar hook-length control protein FliK n=1 Tax=Flavobacterium sp. W21_SRS_FM6 TaxID=3240268 RepID=UPI003F91D9E4
MMQTIASSKSELAAFAALSDPSEASVSSTFEQIFQQQSKQQTAPSSPQKTSAKSSEQTTVPVLNNSAKASDVKPEPNSEDSLIVSDSKSAEELTTSPKNQDPAQDLLESTQPTKTKSVFNGQEEQVVNDEQAEDWVELVYQLQLLNIDEQSQEVAPRPEQAVVNEGEELTDVLSFIDTLANAPRFQEALLKAGFSSLDDFKQQVSGLIDKPNSALTKLLNDIQASPEIVELVSYHNGDKVNQKIEANTVDTNIELFANNVLRLMQQDQLSGSEIKQIQQALNDSVNKNNVISPELLSLVQSKLAATSQDVSQQKDTLASELPQTELDALSQLLTKFTQNEKSRGVKGEIKSQIDFPLNELAAKPQQSPFSAMVRQESNVFDEFVMLVVREAGNSETGDKTAPKTSEKIDLTLPVATGAEKSQSNKLTSDSDLKALLALPTEKIDEALVNIAQRVAAILADEVKAKGANLDLGKASSDAALPNTNSKDILAALKAGVSEFKQQLADGRQPGIDLNALVSQAISQSGDSELSANAAKSIEQSLLGLSQALSLASQLDESAQRQQALAAVDVSFDKLLTQSEQIKVHSASQFESKLDKAINLAKPEAHQQLAEKVRWMVNTNNLIAEIRLDPAELGSMQVKVSLSSDSASVNFVVQSQQTRDALESATPRLREMLADKGIELGQSSVRQESQAKQDNQGQSQQQTKADQGVAANDGLTDDAALMSRPNVNQSQVSGGIDYFV